MANLCAYGVIGSHETDRLPVFKSTIELFEDHRIIHAVYPKLRKVPWIKQIVQIGTLRCKQELSLGELGAVLSHRKTWKTFRHSKYSHALILESDSEIRNASLVQSVLDNHHSNFDILFLGAYNGRTKLRRTGKLQKDTYAIGIPLQSTVFCAYGYLINRNACTHLLKVTQKTAWPIDYWGKWLTTEEGDWSLKVGAVVPEAITTWDAGSTIQEVEDVQAASRLPGLLKEFVVDLRNTVTAFFS